MKHLLVTLLLTACVAGLSSCAGDFSCVCSYTDGAHDTTANTIFTDVKKKDAEDACAAYEASLDTLFSNANCTLTRN